jgi:hypothetical protein
MPTSTNAQSIATMVDQHAKLEGRVTGLERDVQNMARTVEELGNIVREGFGESRRAAEDADRKQAARVAELHTRLDDQFKQTAEGSKPNWGVIVGAVSLVWLIVVAAVAWGMSQATNVAVSKARADIMAVQVDKLDTALQREMRLLDATAQANIENLDHRLQREMKLLDDIGAAKRERISGDLADAHFEVEKLHGFVNDLQSWQITNAERDGKLLARVDAIQAQQDRRWPQFIENAEARGRLTQTVEGLSAAVKALATTPDWLIRAPAPAKPAP